MKNLLKAAMLAIAFGLMFVSVDSVNAQSRQKIRKERREYRKDVRDAQKDYRRRVKNGDYRKARREYREDIRDARRDYRHDTGRNYNSRRRRPVVRYYYRNGRRYVRRY